MSRVLETLLSGVDLSEEEAGQLLRSLTDPSVSPVEKGAWLVALRAKGETAQEIRGMALAMREAALAVRLPIGRPVVDTCGTGGDGSGSFNVSTATALLVAAAGVSVVKHGNRSVSSRCGSADVLEALGIPLVECAESAERQLQEDGFTFLFAPTFHRATAAVVPVRRALGVRTVFNLLGPLTNPAAPPFQLLGAYSEAAAGKMADALAGMPIERALVVHGFPSWDEATPCGPFVQFRVERGAVERTVVDPKLAYGLPRCLPEDLAGGDVEHNAGMMRALLSGERGAVRDAVCLNVGLVLNLVGHTSSVADGIELASATLDSGRGEAFVARLAARHG